MQDIETNEMLYEINYSLERLHLSTIQNNMFSCGWINEVIDEWLGQDCTCSQGFVWLCMNCAILYL